MSAPGSDDAVDQVKARLNLVEVVQRHVRLRRQGRELVGLCPFHQEKTPSFSVNEQKQSWYCHGCGRGGDMFTFVEGVEKVEFRGALELLADLAHVELADRAPGDRRRTEEKRRLLELNRVAQQYYEYVLWQLEAGGPGRRLLEARAVSEATARRFGLGFAPAGGSFAAYVRRKGLAAGDARAAGLVRGDGLDFFQRRLAVPIRDERGQVLAFTARTVVDGEPRKYVNTRETALYSKGRVLFGLDLAKAAIDGAGHAVLMEGQFDVITAHQFGVANAVAASGTALTEDQVRLLKRYTDELVLMFDGDRAGRAAAGRAVELASSLEVRTRVVHAIGAAKDPDEFFRGGGRWEDALKAAPPGWEFLIRDAISDLNPSRPSELEVAVRRVNGVLARIPDPAVRESYRREAALWLGVDERLLVFRPPAGARAAAGPQRGPVPAAGPAPDSEPGLAAGRSGNNLSKSVDYLLQLLAVRPAAVARVKAGLAPADLEGDDRDAYMRMVEVLDRGGAEALGRELGSFPAGEQALVRRAWASPPPSLDDVVVDDVVGRIRRESRVRRRFAIIGGLREAERRGDAAEVARLTEQLAELWALDGR